MSAEHEQAIVLPEARASWLALAIYRYFKDFRYGTLRFRVDGQNYLIEGADPGPEAHIHLHNPMRVLKKVARRGDTGLAEAYMDGDWDSGNLTELLFWGARNFHSLSETLGAKGLVRWVLRLKHMLRSNTRKGSRRNIEAHYDLGNDFYAQWLDPSMTYSSAIFKHEDEPLEQAQTNKYARLLESLNAKPGDHILEVGCGWGGFAEYAAKQGMRVTGITLSREQLAWARERMAKAGLSDHVDLRLQDYRDLNEQFDHVVSIEMFEAVGEAYWGTYFKMLQKVTRPGGRIALQIITINDKDFETYRLSADFIQLYIFPGGMLPSPGVLRQLVDEKGFTQIAYDCFGQDYAKTLAQWHDRCNAHAADIRDRFDERFLRMWRYYLSYCEAGFRDGCIDLCQLVLQKPQAAS